MKTDAAEHEVITFEGPKESTGICIAFITALGGLLLIFVYKTATPWPMRNWLLHGGFCAGIAFWFLSIRRIERAGTIDPEAGVVRTYRRILGFFVRRRSMLFSEVKVVTVHQETDSWVDWVCDILRFWETTPIGPRYEVAMRSEYGDGIVLETYSDASDALTAARMICDRLHLPLRDTTTERMREASYEERHTPYCRQLAQEPESHFNIRTQPEHTIASYEYDGSVLRVHAPRQGCSYWVLLGFWVILLPIVAGAGFAFRAYDSLTDVLLLGLVYLGFLVWSAWWMVTTRRYEAWLTVSAKRITVRIKKHPEIQEWRFPADELRDIWLSDNIGKLDGVLWEALFVGRKALEISSEDAAVPFGLGLSRAELAWLKQLVDYVVSDRSDIRIEDMPVDVWGSVVVDKSSQAKEPTSKRPFVRSAVTRVKRSVRLDLKFTAACLAITAAMLGGIIVVVRPHLAPELSSPPTSEPGGEVRRMQEEIDRIGNSEDYKKGMESYRRWKEQADSQPAAGIK